MDVSSRKVLGEFLRSRRERLSPEDVGLISYGRRRTKGLRREEVAQLAHIGTSWYTSLEQGRNIKPSEEVLNHMPQALRLTEDERRHLQLLEEFTQSSKLFREVWPLHDVQTISGHRKQRHDSRLGEMDLNM